MGFGVGREEGDGADGLFDGFLGETFGEEGGGVLLFFEAAGGFGGAEDLGDVIEGGFDSLEDGDGLLLELLEVF